LAEADKILLRTFARRCGVYLLLTALALQLAVSFGHFHRHDIVGYSRIDVVAGWQAPTKLQAPARLEASKQSPSGLADDDEHCPICLVTLLLSTSFIPDAPQASPSSVFQDVGRSFGPAFDIVFGSDRAAFQSRAPPAG